MEPDDDQSATTDLRALLDPLPNGDPGEPPPWLPLPHTEAQRCAHFRVAASELLARGGYDPRPLTPEDFNALEDRFLECR